VPAKLALIVIALGACACTLLAMRQSRLQVASELTQTQLRINAADERLWSLRVRIAAEVAPQHIQRLATELGELRPLAEAPLPVADVPSSDGVRTPAALGPPAIVNGAISAAPNAAIPTVGPTKPTKPGATSAATPPATKKSILKKTGSAKAAPTKRLSSAKPNKER